MRLGVRLGPVYASGSTRGATKGLTALFMLPVTLIYYTLVWPFVFLFRALNKGRSHRPDPAPVPRTPAPMGPPPGWYQDPQGSTEHVQR